MSAEDDQGEERLFIVLINEEGQYSLWPQGMVIPNGWRAVGPEGTREECSKYVDTVWTDMRPLSLRKKMEELAVKN